MTTLNGLPATLQAIIQQGFLERMFQESLMAKLGFRMIADKEIFPAKIGESITKTRPGLLAPVTTPMAPASLTDISSGLTLQNWSVEQYVLSVAQYAAPIALNVVTDRVALGDVFLQNAKALGEQAARSIDTLAQKALYDQYMGGNTRVTTTLGAPGTAVKVDDVRGFFMTLTSNGVPVVVSASNTLTVVVGSSSYTLTGVVADGTAPSAIVPWLSNLSFSGTSSNSSTTPGGYSGTLTFSGNVAVADATLGNAVQAATAPLIIRPSLSTTNVMAGTTAAISSANDINFAKLTMDMVLTAKATMSANNVPTVGDTGSYNLYLDPLQAKGLFGDPAFQQFFRGRPDTEEYRKGIVYDQLGVKLIETNINPVQTLSGVGVVRRGILCGQGALVEAYFPDEAYSEAADKAGNNPLITVIDGISHITRPPLDTVQQVITQAWSYIGGFVAPTDTTTNTTTIPTATNAAYKRGIILETL